MGEKRDYLIIGKIVRPFGTRGEVKLLPITDDINRFHSMDFIFFRRGEQFEKVAVENVRISMDAVYIKLEGVATRDDAERLRNSLVYIDREHAAQIDDSSYYYYDIMGCTVKTEQGDTIGTVFDIQNAGSCDVYCVRPAGSSDGELLIPAVHDVVKNIDIGKKEIYIEALDGLL